AAALRARGRTFFESDLPARVEWGETSLTADQLFQMLFLVGPLEPSHALMIALFLGVLPHDTPPRDLRDRKRRDRLLSQATVPVEDARVQPVAEFLRSMALACTLDVRVLVDG